MPYATDYIVLSNSGKNHCHNRYWPQYDITTIVRKPDICNVTIDTVMAMSMVGYYELNKMHRRLIIKQ